MLSSAGWVQLQTDNTERLPGRKSHHMGEAGVQRHRNAAVIDSEAQEPFVGGP